MRRFLQYTIIGVLGITVLGLLVNLCTILFPHEYQTQTQYTPQEAYQGIKKSFDETVAPALEEGMEQMLEALKDPQKVLDEFRAD